MLLFKSVFFLFYRFLLMPLALCLILLFIWPFNKKIQSSIRLRTKEKFKVLQKSDLIWVHASSGEFEYAKPIIRELKKMNPNITVLVTYFSPSYAKQIESFPGVDYALPLPLDLPGPITEFLKNFKPKMLLIARTDLWPELLQQVHRQKIPTLLFSATFRPLAGSRVFLKFYYKMIFSFFTDIYTVSEMDQKNIISTNPTVKIKIAGDTRYDQVIFRLKHPSVVKENLFSPNSLPYLIAGSTWSEDEKVLLESCHNLLKENKIKLVIAPHEPTETHLSQLINAITSYELSFSLYSSAPESNATEFSSQIMIIDKPGILADIYSYGKIAFVGGSFKNKVHSVMEPLSAGLPTLVGPKHLNNREAIQFQKIPVSNALTAVTAVKDSSDFEKTLRTLLSSSELGSHIPTIIQAEINKRSGASDKVIDWINQHIGVTK